MLPLSLNRLGIGGIVFGRRVMSGLPNNTRVTNSGAVRVLSDGVTIRVIQT